MNFDLNTMISLLFIAGGGGAVAGILNVVKTFRSGKIENEETLIRRLDSDNKKQKELREIAEARAEQAESEAEGYRKQRNEARESLALLRFHVMEKYGEQPPTFGEKHD